jgi:gliding motility-associated protein GldC
MKKSEIKIEVGLDENNIPETMEWNATDNGNSGKVSASFVSVWDADAKNTLRIDLWTKEFSVDEMKMFMFQNIMSMADSLQKATGMNEEAEDMRDFGRYMGERFGLLKVKPKQ